MSDSMRITIIDNSGLAREALEAACLRALEKCGLTAEGYAKLLCPVDMGMLRNSITHVTATKDGETIKYTKEDQKEGKTSGKPLKVKSSDEHTVYIGSSVFYAPYVELGTGKYYPGGRPTPWVYQDAQGNWHLTHGQRAQPYLKPAVADHAAQYREIIDQELKNG